MVSSSNEGFHLRRHNEEATVDPPAVAARLFREAYGAVAIIIECTEAARWLNRGDSRQPALASVQVDDRAHVDIGDTIAIGQAERLFIAHIRNDSLDTATNLGVVAGVDQGDPPRLSRSLVHSGAFSRKSMVTSDMCRK